MGPATYFMKMKEIWCCEIFKSFFSIKIADRERDKSSNGFSLPSLLSYFPRKRGYYFVSIWHGGDGTDAMCTGSSFLWWVRAIISNELIKQYTHVFSSASRQAWHLFVRIVYLKNYELKDDDALLKFKIKTSDCSQDTSSSLQQKSNIL